MTTKKQIAANRRNARKSTGPRTGEGKERSSQNAVTHGMTSRRAVLADEDPRQYMEFRISVHEELGPRGSMETTLANRIAALFWRLARVPAIEAEMIDALRGKPTDDSGDSGGSGGSGALATVWEEDESAYGGSLSRLSRYETTLERSLIRCQAEFRRLQERREKREVAEMKRYEHESDRYVVGGMEALEREPDGSYRKPGSPAGQGGTEGGGRPGAELRKEPNSDGGSIGIQTFPGISGDDGT